MNRKQRRAAGKPGSTGAGSQGPASSSTRARTLAAAAQQHHQAGRLDLAIAVMNEATRADPSDPGHLSNLGVLLQEGKRLAEAAECFHRALRLAPGHPLLLNNLGFALQQQGDLEGAVACYKDAIRRNPAYPEALFNLGNALRDQGRLDEAAACFGQALRLAPHDVEVLNNLGSVLQERGDLDGAVVCFGEALRCNPADARTHYNLGNALRDRGKPDEAIAHYREAVRLAPGDSLPLNNLGLLLQDRGDLEGAVACFGEAQKLAPQDTRTLANQGIALHLEGRLDAALQCLERASALKPHDFVIQTTLLSHAMYRDDFDPERIEALHRRFGAAFSHPEIERPVTDRDPGRRLRIGYLSADLREHPVGRNLLPIVRNQDRDTFALHFYAQAPRRDEVAAEFRALADGWTDITRLSDAEAAARIRADAIDILVSLAGHFDLNRPAICGWRAAPIQISMHDAATSGLTTMDYIIGDRWMLPRQGREYFSERKLRVPVFWVAAPPDPLPAASAVSLSGGPVFGSYNNPAKITPSALATWGRILARLPEAQLVLRYQNAYRSPTLREHVGTALAAAGARLEQIRFITEKAPFQEVMESYNQIDLALDPFPFSGWTSSHQALMTGTPVITLSWPRMVSTGTIGMLEQVGLGELVAGSPEDYVEKAVAFAAHREEWRRRRPALQARALTSPLCDGPRLARNLERLYRAVWRRHCAGQTG